MKKLLCLIAVMLLLTACSSDSTDTAAQPEPAESRPAEETVQRATDTVQRTAEQAVERGQELVEEGSDRLAALVPSAVNFEHGSSIYQQNCSSCHNGGLMGAPQIGHARYGADIDELTENTITGIGRMPARGGNPRLSDEDIRAAVEYMVDQSK